MKCWGKISCYFSVPAWLIPYSRFTNTWWSGGGQLWSAAIHVWYRRLYEG